MTKKLIVKELWLLDEDGCNEVKLTPLEENEIPSLVSKESITGGYGNINAKQNE